MNPRSRSATVSSNLRDRIRQSTADDILAAAEAVFAEQGLRNAPMGEIAARAGMAVGTLYNHFADKESLVEALRSARSEELLARLDDALGQGAFAEQLTAFVESLWSHYEAHSRLFLALMGEDQGAGAPSGKRKAAMSEVYQRAQKLIERGIHARVLRADPEHLLPSMLLGLIKGMSIRSMCAQSDWPVVDTARAVDFFLSGARRG